MPKPSCEAGRERLPKILTVQDDPLEARTGHRRFERSSNAFDFWKFRHSWSASAHQYSRMGGSIRCEVLPDLLHHARIDDARVLPFGLLLGKQHDLHRAALRAERGGIEDVETFVNGVGLGHSSFDFERMDWRHF